MMKLKLLWLTLLVSLNAYSQENIPVGTWRSHFNYEQMLLVEEVNGKIYGASSQGLIFYDKEDNSLNRISKIDGLSDVGISALSFDDSRNLFAVGYENGNIDIIGQSEILNVTLLKDSDITESKRINDISFFQDRAFVSTDFGVLVVDPITGEIDEAFRNLGAQGVTIQVHNATFLNNRIYLSTEVGVLQGEVSPNVNLQDFNNWERFEGGQVQGLAISEVSFLGNNIYAATGTELFVFDGNVWENTGLDFSGEVIRGIKNSILGLIIISDASLRIFSGSGLPSVITTEAGDAPMDALVDADGIVWYADGISGLSSTSEGTVSRFVSNGVFASDVVRLELNDNKIYAFPTSSVTDLVSAKNGLGYGLFEGGNWNNISSEAINGFQDITDFAETQGGNVYISSYGNGLMDLSNNIIYDDSNSPLQPTGLSNQIIVTAIESDRNGNLWVAHLSPSPLLRLSADGDWSAFSFGTSASGNPADLRISETGDVWMVLDPDLGGGILAFDPETEESRYINSSNGSLPSTKVTDLEFDKNGQIWIGTEEGIAYFPFSQGVIQDNSLDVIRPVFGNRFLLEDEFISSVEVDEGNRKWIGTQAGLWLFEDAGDALVTNFTTENSPIPSNNIVDVKIEPITGEVFIVTDMGTVSFRGDASKGASTHQEVAIFPNPIQPGYSGLVGISGLARDVTLKITNVSGRLVREINASGGGASWDLTDYRGVRAQSGVYLVFSSSEDGSETFVGKIAIVN